MLRHPAIIKSMIDQVPIFECLMIDYNANIHCCLQKVITELNEILYVRYIKENDIFTTELFSKNVEENMQYYHHHYRIGIKYSEIKENLSNGQMISKIIFYETIIYTRTLISSLNKGKIKKIYIALDGIPSMAKIKEQRNRRYIGLNANNIRNDIINKYKFENNNVYQIDQFHYRSEICTGTKFMDDIQQALFNLDLNIEIEVSTTNIKGEGEKKIIHALDDHDMYQSYCIMSPDSDMFIMMGIIVNNDKYKDKKVYNFRIDCQHENEYQFFDLKSMIENFRKYYSQRLEKDITDDKIFIDVFFMLFVFGNDFLPKLEPLDIKLHFDTVCEICINLSLSGLKLINENKLNYHYLIEFFESVENKIADMCIEKSLSNTYNNYHKLCEQMSVSKTYLENNYHHPLLKPININHLNFMIYRKVLITSFSKMMNYIGNTYVKPEDVPYLIKEIHQDPNDSYLMLVLPKLLRFPGSNSNDNNFFLNFVNYINSTKDYNKNVKFRIKLMENKNDNFQPRSHSALVNELDKFDRSMEPYRSIFKIQNVELISYDLYSRQIIDMRDKYYDMYVKNGMTNEEIKNMVLEYLIGIEWLYKNYIVGEHLEWSAWKYNYTQPPLIRDIIKCLKSNVKNDLSIFLSYYIQHDMTPMEHYLYITPNEYTNANISPNLSDVLHLIDGYGALYLNKCQIKWHEYDLKR